MVEKDRKVPFIVYLATMGISLIMAFIAGVDLESPYSAVVILILGLLVIFKLAAWEDNLPFAETVKSFMKSFKK